MDDRRLGSIFRSVRLRSGRTQDEIGIAAGVSRHMVGRIERGRLAGISIEHLRAVAAALDIELDLRVFWRGGDLGRLINARHASLHEAMAGQLSELEGWQSEPEVSFSIDHERGVIDVLAWHAVTRTLLIIELKSELVDINDLMSTMDRRRRLAVRIGRARGWDPATVSTWVAVADSRTNRRVLTRHRTVLRSKFPDDGHRIRSWLVHPSGSVTALSFLTIEQVALGGARVSGARRVRHARTEPGKPPSTDR